MKCDVERGVIGNVELMLLVSNFFFRGVKREKGGYSGVSEWEGWERERMRGLEFC